MCIRDRYKGTFVGTDLSAYKITPRSDATPFTSIMEEDKTESLKRYYETDVIAGDALTAAVNEADGFSRTVAEKLKSPEELAKLGVDTPTGLFKMVSESPKMCIRDRCAGQWHSGKFFRRAGKLAGGA